ncbi:MAG TPA: hypothetical protein VGM74_16620 [Burkholderiaceae bacterium]
MKTWNIEIQRVKAMNNANGLIRAQIDALVQPATGRDDGVPTTTLQFTEETARVLMLLLKTQLAEFDGRKAKSRR